jgi:hypothetical protein
MAPPPCQDAVDCVAYLNEAWTPYHSVLASCKQLLAAGFQVCEDFLFFILGCL